MENFDELRVLIREKIYSNNNSEITGSILQNILIAMTNNADSSITGLISRVSDIEEFLNGEISGEVNLLNYYTKDETNSLLRQYATKEWVESQGFATPEDFRYIATQEAEREAKKVSDELSDFAEGITKDIAGITDEIDALRELIDSFETPDLSGYIQDGDTIDALAMTKLQVGGYILTHDAKGLLIEQGELKVNGIITAIGLEGVSSQVATHEDLGKYATKVWVENNKYLTESSVYTKEQIDNKGFATYEEAEILADDVFNELSESISGLAVDIGNNTDEIDALKESIGSIVIPDLSGYIKDGDTINALAMTTLQVGNYSLTADAKGFVIEQGELKINGKITALGIDGVSSQVATHEDLGKYLTTSNAESTYLKKNSDIELGTHLIKGNGGANIVDSVGQWVILGSGVAAKGWPTYVDGNEIYLRYGTSHTTAIHVRNNGNVDIYGSIGNDGSIFCNYGVFSYTSGDGLYMTDYNINAHNKGTYTRQLLKFDPSSGKVNLVNGFETNVTSYIGGHEILTSNSLKIGEYAFQDRTENRLSSTTDLNNVSYGVWGTLDNTTYTNAPIQNFGLIVSRLNQTYKGQLLLPYGNRDIYYRAQYYNNGKIEWYDWRKILTDAGGTINGSLTVTGTVTIGSELVATKKWVEDKEYATYDEAESLANEVWNDLSDVATGLEEGINDNYNEIVAIKQRLESITIPDISIYIKDGDTINALAMTKLQVGNYSLTADTKGFLIEQGELKVNGKITALGIEGVSSQVATHEDLGKYLTTSNAESTYLKNIGGTITGSGGDLLSINRKDGFPVIRFDYNDGIMGRLGFNTNGELVAQIGGTYYKVITSAGGTVDGTLSIKGDYGKNTYTNGNNFYTTGSVGGWAMGISHMSMAGSALGSSAAAYGEGENLKWFFYGGSYNDASIYITPEKSVGIGISSPVSRLEVAGAIKATSEVFSYKNSTKGVYLGESCICTHNKGAWSGTPIWLSGSATALLGYTYIGGATNTEYIPLVLRRLEHGLSLNNTADSGYIVFGQLQNNGESVKAEKVLRIGDNGLQYSSNGGTSYYDIITSNGGTISNVLNINNSSGKSIIIEGNTMTSYGAENNWYVDKSSNAYFYTTTSRYFYGTLNNSSDEKLKNILGNVELTIPQIANAPAITFTWKNNIDNDRHVGTIAQYWKNILPEVVHGEEGNLSMNYVEVALISSILLARNAEIQQAQIERIQTEIKNLQSELDKLKTIY